LSLFCFSGSIQPLSSSDIRENVTYLVFCLTKPATSKEVLLVHSTLTTLDFRRAGFGLFRDLFGRVFWDKALEGKGA